MKEHVPEAVGITWNKFAIVAPENYIATVLGHRIDLTPG
jgi:hypothetical protein